MKKLLLSIITIFLIFSIENVTAKENGLVEDLLNLNYGPMIYDLSLDNLNTYSFKDQSLKNTYLTMVNYDKVIKDEIIYQYQKGTYSTATTKGIVNNYKKFIYYTNELFYFLNQIEKHPYLKKEPDIQDGILNNYKNSASYYKKVKNLTFEKE